MKARIFTAAVVVAASLVGCGSQAIQPAKPPPPVEPRTQVEPHRTEDEPKLIAPPPAYGNKVVMAKLRTAPHL